jgi:hypothetical protein
MKRFKPPVGGLRHELLPKRMPCVRASKPRFLKVCVPLACAAPVLVALLKTHLQHLGIAAAINVVLVVAWLDGDELAPTRVSAFQKLYLAA